MRETTDTRVGMVVQARMGSTRLPGKVLMPLGGTTLLGWIVTRLRELPRPLVVATSHQVQDDAIVRECERIDVACFRGSEHDVLDRYYQCARAHRFAHVIRLTGDNPCPDIEALRQLVDLHLVSGADYSHNFGELPVGMGAEIFSFGALEVSWRDGRAAHHREHVNEFILEHPSRFRIAKLDVCPDHTWKQLRLTIDTREDYQRIAGYLSDGVNEHIGREALIQRCSSCA
ncbi:MAG: cytidylyltransferase domain-containing protein [Nitrospirota bacterium]